MYVWLAVQNAAEAAVAAVVAAASSASFAVTRAWASATDVSPDALLQEVVATTTIARPTRADDARQPCPAAYRSLTGSPAVPLDVAPHPIRRVSRTAVPTVAIRPMSVVTHRR